MKKGQHLGRQAVYHDFKIAGIQPSSKEEQKSSMEWKQEGQKSIFAEAMAAAKLQMATHSVGIPDFTFLTGMGHHNNDDDVADAIAGSVMQKVATDMGLGTSAALLVMKDKALLPPTYVCR